MRRTRPLRALLRALALAGIALAVPPRVAAAQVGAVARLPDRARWRAELRADVIAGHATAYQAGAGLNLPFGTYARVGLVAAAGATRAAAATHASARGDVYVRFLLDPLSEYAHGLSAGGGISLRDDGAGRARAYLLVLVDLEGDQRRGGWHGFVPALQVGLGGGARVGIALRRVNSRWR